VGRGSGAVADLARIPAVQAVVSLLLQHDPELLAEYVRDPVHHRPGPGDGDRWGMCLFACECFSPSLCMCVCVCVCVCVGGCGCGCSGPGARTTLTPSSARGRKCWSPGLSRPLPTLPRRRRRFPRAPDNGAPTAVSVNSRLRDFEFECHDSVRLSHFVLAHSPRPPISSR